MAVLEVTAYTGLGAGPHDVVITDVLVKVAKAGGDYLRWEFADKNDNKASVNTSKDITPGNKTGKWMGAVTGRPVVVGERRDTDELIGKPASIFIEINAEGYPKVISVTGRQADPRVVSAPYAEQQLKAATDKAAATHAAQEGGTDPLGDLPF
jgi:hypothetical protein